MRSAGFFAVSVIRSFLVVTACFLLLSFWRVVFPETIISPESGFRITRADTPYILWTEVEYRFDGVNGRGTVSRHGLGPSFYVTYDYMCACVTYFYDYRSERTVSYHPSSRTYRLDDGISDREVPFDVVRDDLDRAILFYARYSTKYWPKEYTV